VFEPTTTLKVAFFVAVDSFTLRDEADIERFELGISTAASLAKYVIENEVPPEFSSTPDSSIYPDRRGTGRVATPGIS